MWMNGNEVIVSMTNENKQRDMEVEEIAQADKREGPPNYVSQKTTDAPRNASENSGESDMTLTDMLYDKPNNAKPDRLAESMF
jgi:hypothetical protein